MKKFICMLLLLSMTFALCACGGDTNDDNDKTINSISKLLNIEMTEKCLIESNESENGFVTVKIEDEKTDSEIKTEWNELPLTENLTALIYGIESDTSSVGPYITKDDVPLFPEIENGYYYFVDQHTESTDSKDDTEIFDRNSFNLVIAIYDTDTNRLYYCQFDT